jgi:hypothetical protein
MKHPKKELQQTELRKKLRKKERERMKLLKNKPMQSK